MNKIIKKIIPIPLKCFIAENRHFITMLKKGIPRKIRELVKLYKGELNIDDINKWERKFLKMLSSYPELYEIVTEFFQSDIKILKSAEREFRKDEVILICVQKNDLLRMIKFIEYHRSIGIKQFVVIDNNSDEDTLEWFYKQEDLTLMQVSSQYTTNRREAWINRVLAYYGENRWYLVVDSDEFLYYQDCESKNINDVIEFMSKNNIKRVRAVMIDMYAQPHYYEHGNAEDFFSECQYFDTDSYYFKDHTRLCLISGGPRQRVFNQAPWLTKYPLFYLERDDVECKSHFMFPYKKNLLAECQLVLKHYKFLPGEIEKYKKIVSQGNYYNNSAQYRSYLAVMEKTSALDFFYHGTEKYVDSNSLNNICIYSGIRWD